MHAKRKERGETITSREMKAIEVNAQYFGISRLQLMENAGRAVAQEIASQFKTNSSVRIFCGLGGNGGDGFVAARHLSASGFKVEVIVAGKVKDISDETALQNWNALQMLTSEVSIREVYDSALVENESKVEVIVDALLGIGTKGALRPPFGQMVKAINSSKAFCVAVDVPTGVDSDTGQVLSDAVKADLTVTFYKTKSGFGAAGKYCGEILVRDIGLPWELENYAGPGDVLKVAKSRSSQSHKGDFGRLLVIGGSETYSGAPTLVALGAQRTGVDLVYIATPENTAYSISSMSPDLITVKLEGTHLNPDNVKTLKPYIDGADTVAIGPGLGLHPETVKAVKLVLELAEKAGKPVLLDADGLKAFAEFKRPLTSPLVLTPHAGEYAKLTGKQPSIDLPKRTTEVDKTSADLNSVILLKGAVDVISNGKKHKLNFTGNPGMTVGGTGDVLSGIVAAFLAQHVDPFESAVAGAFINGAAGDFVYQEKGYHMTASDLIQWIPIVIDDPLSHLQVRTQFGRRAS
jgi:hydroxyethylthiazole kinase-like uncharacterized protein yjeF